MTILLHNTLVWVCQRDFTWLELPVECSPMYHSLIKGGRQPFRHYKYNFVRSRHCPPSARGIGRYGRLRRLIRAIRHQGFDPSPPRMRLEGRTWQDGHTRAAILLYLFGPDLELTLNDQEVTGIVEPS